MPKFAELRAVATGSSVSGRLCMHMIQNWPGRYVSFSGRVMAAFRSAIVHVQIQRRCARRRPDAISFSENLLKHDTGKSFSYLGRSMFHEFAYCMNRMLNFSHGWCRDDPDRLGGPAATRFIWFPNFLAVCTNTSARQKQRGFVALLFAGASLAACEHSAEEQATWVTCSHFPQKLFFEL